MEVHDVSGALEAVCQSGNVRVSAIGGSAEIRASFGQVEAKGIGEHQVRTSFGDIRFAWPEGQAADVAAEATFGTINSRLPLRIETSSSRQRAEGSTGSGGATILLDVDNGSVILEND